MCKFSELGFDIKSEVTIQAPWGGSQTKPKDVDAYLVKKDDGEL